METLELKTTATEVSTVDGHTSRIGATEERTHELKENNRITQSKQQGGTSLGKKTHLRDLVGTIGEGLTVISLTS